jgi:hypothetical protein
MLIHRPSTIFLALGLLALAVAPVLAIEEPRFEVVKRFEDFELRRYEPFVIAEVEIRDGFEEAGDRAFSTLFDYISGANSGAASMDMTAPVLQGAAKGESMAMTAPVLQTLDADAYRVSFVLPLRFDLASAPRPTDARVELREVPERLMAARRYSGFWSQERYREQEQALLSALAGAGYEAVASPEWARYNAPFIPWFLRRNEVLVEVRPVGTR